MKETDEQQEPQTPHFYEQSLTLTGTTEHNEHFGESGGKEEVEGVLKYVTLKYRCPGFFVFFFYTFRVLFQKITQK